MGAARYSWLGAPGSDPPFCVAIVHQTPRARVGDIGGSQSHASPGGQHGPRAKGHGAARAERRERPQSRHACGGVDLERRDPPGHNPVTKECPCSGKSPVQCFLSSSKFGSRMDSQYVSTMLLISATLSGVICGSISIGSVCLLWVRRQVFGQAGAALCAAGVVLLGLSIWGSVELLGDRRQKTATRQLFSAWCRTRMRRPSPNLQK